MASTEWPSPYYCTGQYMTEYHCTTTGLLGSTFAGDSMRHVMNFADDGAIRSLGRYIAAALLNARSGRTPVLDEASVRRLWNDFLLNGFYEPTAGTRWGAGQIVTYLKSTIG